jgi:hypothetical protein
LFPEDLQKAIDLCANQGREFCCSVIWPLHIKTFGAVGIILRPRSIKSITSICTSDGGTRFNPETGKREGAGSPFSEQGVMDTFARATDYNEWNIENADTIGIFVHPTAPLLVAKRVLLAEIPGYDPSMGNGEEMVDGQDRIGLTEIAAQFPSSPIYSFRGADIVGLDGTKVISVNPSDLHGL